MKLTEEEASIEVEKLPVHQAVEQLWIDMNGSEEDMAIKSNQTSTPETNDSKGNTPPPRGYPAQLEA